MLPIVQKFYNEVFQYMDNNKLDTITNLFEGKEIRSVWNSEKEDYFFSVVDVVSALTDSKIPRNYWSDLKRKLKMKVVSCTKISCNSKCNHKKMEKII